jgi:cytochrome d ubiquinol oxidase subunit I|tara:strand:+ start:23007 stop:24353 length:1347 start_codon:yes stop_codon:yes gene_type:complete
MTNSPLWLAQIQFFTSLGFLSLFLLLELGLAWLLVYFKLRATLPGDQRGAFIQAYRFWARIFALTSILALAAGFPVLIQLGTLWPGLMARIGEVAGPLLAAAVLTTFIMKSCFLGAMLFGQRRMSDRAHTLVVVMVAFGLSLALFWILALFAWMQAPAGAQFIEGRYLVTSWLDVLFSPLVFTFISVTVALALFGVAFMMIGVTSRQSLWQPVDHAHRHVFRTGLAVAALASTCLLGALGVYSQQVAELQPGKAAATAAYWQTGTNPDLALVGWPSEEQQTTHGTLLISDLGRLFLGQDETGSVLGLDNFAGMHAPVALTFWSWRLLIVIVVLAWLLALTVLFGSRRSAVDITAVSPRLRRGLSCLTYLGLPVLVLWLAYVWFGQLPYAVSGSVTTTEILAATGAGEIFAGLLAYSVVYVLLFAAFVRLVRYFMRYGVIPVGRQRGRA